MKIKLHKNLDQKIWDKNDNLYPDVSDMLLSIAWAYIDYIRNEYSINIKNSDIQDILVFGSVTQLFYDKKSDIDVCIVLNLDNAEQQFPNLQIEKQLKLYYFDRAMVHICKIYNRKIDLNFQNMRNPDFDGRYRRGPIYSLLKKEWVLKPVSLSKQEIKNLETQATVIYKQILNDYKKVKSNGFQLNEINEFYANIIASKEHSLENDNERIINPVYMAIRKFKHDGYITKLRNKAIQKETEKYVLK